MPLELATIPLELATMLLELATLLLELATMPLELLCCLTEGQSFRGVLMLHTYYLIICMYQSISICMCNV